MTHGNARSVLTKVKNRELSEARSVAGITGTGKV